VRPNQPLPLKMKIHKGITITRALLSIVPLLAFGITWLIKKINIFELIWPFELFKNAYIPMAIICMVIYFGLLSLVVIFRKQRFKSLLFSIIICVLGILLLYLGLNGSF